MQKAPQYQPPAEDPQTASLKLQAQTDEIAANENRVQIDSASLLARYGTRLTLAGASGASPTMAGPLAQSYAQSPIKPFGGA